MTPKEKAQRMLAVFEAAIDRLEDQRSTGEDTPFDVDELIGLAKAGWLEAYDVASASVLDQDPEEIYAKTEELLRRVSE